MPVQILSFSLNKLIPYIDVLPEHFNMSLWLPTQTLAKCLRIQFNALCHQRQLCNILTFRFIISGFHGIRRFIEKCLLFFCFFTARFHIPEPVAMRVVTQGWQRPRIAGRN
ncbi:hypothetical protein BGP84_02030 [Pseudomonas putida]|uniref:Uncharacterized protein n=1 Tax=Pseudomonas putida TaxID=303 RepID=A0A2S3X9I1_PSEPU|nr:hypothetical protein BGP85_23285 [Pseudomonas putida]POG12083.1 hypothetical protein BGP84_02030 [Pseudomonas putida]